MGVRTDDQMHGAGRQAARQLDIARDAHGCAVLTQAVPQMAENDQHVAERAHGRNQIEGSPHRIGDAALAVRLRADLGGRDQADETNPHPLDDEERRRETACSQLLAARHIGGQHWEMDIPADGVRQQRDAPVEIMVTERPHVNAHLGVEAISGMNLIRFGRSPEERVEDRASALIAGRRSQHGHLRILGMAGARPSQPGSDAREDGHIALWGETGDVAVEVVEVQELDADWADPTAGDWAASARQALG